MQKTKVISQLNLMPEDFESKASLARTIKKIIFTAGIFILILISYFILLGYSVSLTKTQDEISSEIDKINQQIQEYAKFEANNIQSQLIMIRKILDNHIYWKDFFKSIESNTMPFVQFDKLSVSAGKLEAILSGQAASYTALAQQIIIFERDKQSFSQVIFSNIRQNKNGSIGFELKLALSKNMFFQLK